MASHPGLGLGELKGKALSSIASGISGSGSSWLDMGGRVSSGGS